MTIQGKRIEELIEEMAESRRKTATNMRLGEFIDRLNSFPVDAPVVFDFNDQPPGYFASYRGYYEDLALSWFDASESVHVCELLVHANAANGSTFQGYKGGDFDMTRKTLLWADTWGLCRNRAIVDVQEIEGRVLIMTEIIE